MTVLEVMVGIAIMGIVGGSISILVGTAIKAKLISSVRSSNTETSRSTLEWMTERLRNAGLNLQPSVQTELRCQDLVVAQDATLWPTATSVFVSGEMLNTNAVSGDEDATIGYYLGTDPVTGATVVMEYNQPCSAGAAQIATYSHPLSSPRLQVLGLSFQYFDAAGRTVTNLTSAVSIQTIRVINVSVTVQGSEGRSGVQTQTLARIVVLRNPEPNANNWLNVNENF